MVVYHGVKSKFSIPVVTKKYLKKKDKKKIDVTQITGSEREREIVVVWYHRTCLVCFSLIF